MVLAQLLHLLSCRHRRSQKPNCQSEVSQKGSQQESRKPLVESGTVESQSASELKVKGNSLFSQGDVASAVACWSEARQRIAKDNSATDVPNETLELLRSLDANLALGHLRLQDYTSALRCADAALSELASSSSKDVKVLHRRALALAGLKRWIDAEHALRDFEEAGGASSLALQTRRDWGRVKQKIAASVMKKMNDEEEVIPHDPNHEWAEDEFWAAPKLDWMAVYPLRQHSDACGICWDEDAGDFNDTVWTPDGMSGRKAYHFSIALPLSTLAGAALAGLRVPATPTIHILHSDPMGSVSHDWASFLKRSPGVQILNVVYVRIFSAKDTSDTSKHGQRGVLTKPVEEARIDDRVVKVSRLTGSYQELLTIIVSNGLTELQAPWLAISLDVPIAIDGQHAEEQLCDIMNAITCITAQNTPLLVTLPANSRGRQLRVPAQRSIAAFRLLQPKAIVKWQWNRFAVCKKIQSQEAQDQQTMIGAFAVIGVFLFGDCRDKLGQQPLDILNALDVRRVPQDDGKDVGNLSTAQEQDRNDQMQDMLESEKFQKQFQAFKKKMEKEGRPTGPEITREEQHRQGMEFAAWIQSCTRFEWENESLTQVEDVCDDENPSTSQDKDACDDADPNALHESS